MHTKALFTALLILGMSPLAEATIGVCRGRPLPAGKTRHLRNLRLECTSSVDHYIRRPQPFDVKAWRTMEMSQRKDKRERMQAIGQQLPPIEWRGVIPYETVEVWDWTDWVYGADPSCGYDTVVTTDSKGNKTETEVMRSCWHDEDRSEARHCSNENIRYQAQFVRPSLQEWGPHVKDADELKSYYDILPNKYDLLPGEVEDVQVFSGWSQDTEVKPFVEVGDAWNEYEFGVRFENGQQSVVCRHDANHELDVAVYTKARLRKRSPNAFRAGVDDYGRPLAETFDWQEAIGKDGKYTRSIPRALRLLDVSETLIASLARQSRTFEAGIEKAKSKNGVGANTTKEESIAFESDPGFWKDTMVRVKLMRKHTAFGVDALARDRRLSQRLYLHGSDVSDRGRYNISLISDEKKRDLYRTSGPVFEEWWNNFHLNLEPGVNHEFRVSMYQKGVPFYAQDCDDPRFRSHWNCRLGLRGEDNWYSKELPLPFITAATYDSRGFVEKLNDFQGKSLTEKFRSIMPW